MKNLNQNKNLTIIIVLFKESFELISKTLDQIQNYKIVIVDNANDAELQKKIISSYKIDTYLLNKENIGFSAGYNQGIKQSQTKYTLVLGPDCIIENKDINILIDKFSVYKNLAIVTPTSYDNENNLSYSGGPLPEKSDKNIILNLEGDVCVDSALGACMLFKTEDFEKKMIFFDENFFLYFSDDDLCRRIKNFKKSIIQVYEAKCIHQHGIIKVRNKYQKIFIREYNFTHDKFYYFYKMNEHLSIIDSFKKKLPKYLIKLVLKIIVLKFHDAVRLFSRIYAYYKFKIKYSK